MLDKVCKLQLLGRSERSANYQTITKNSIKVLERENGGRIKAQTGDLGPFNSPFLYLLDTWALMCHLLRVKSVELRRLSEAEETSQAWSVKIRLGCSHGSSLRLFGSLWPN